MNFFKRIFIFLYAIILLKVAVMTIVVSFDVLSIDLLLKYIVFLREHDSFKIFFSFIGCIFLFLSINSFYKLGKSFNKNKVIAFKNQEGELSVAISAIEEYVKKIVKDIFEVKDVKSFVKAKRNNMEIFINVSVDSQLSIPNITEKIHKNVKQKIQEVLGIEKKLIIKIHVKKIFKSANTNKNIELLDNSIDSFNKDE